MHALPLYLAPGKRAKAGHTRRLLVRHASSEKGASAREVWRTDVDRNEAVRFLDVDSDYMKCLVPAIDPK